MQEYFQNKRQSKPYKDAVLPIYVHEIFSSADNVMLDTLSNACNIECCIKNPYRCVSPACVKFHKMSLLLTFATPS